MANLKMAASTSVAILVLGMTTMGVCRVGAAESAVPQTAEASWSVAMLPNNSFGGFIVKGDKPVLQFEMAAWGPNWSWLSPPTAKDTAVDGELKTSGQLRIGDAQVKINLQARKSSDSAVTYRYDLSAEKDFKLTMIAAVFSMAGPCAGQVVVKTANGAEKTLPIPLVRAQNPIEAATQLKFQVQGVGDWVVNLTPGCTLQQENGALRVMLAHDTFEHGTRPVTLEMVSPERISFLASKSDLDKMAVPMAGPDWFVFEPRHTFAPGVIGVNNWLDKPAGKHGMARIVGDHFEFADSTKVKFWGVNLAYGGSCCPNKPEADQTAARFAKYGVNCVRLHKFCGPGWEGIGDPKDGTKLTTNGLDHLDYFCAKLAESGVYYGFSHTFGYIVRPANKDRLLAYSELAKVQGKTYGLINYAEDVQDLLIEMVVGLLKHPNPYTHKTYAEDPALAYIELQNEDDIFFFSSGGALEACPTYRKHVVGKFSDWLKEKYKSQDVLAKSWGDALKATESLDQRNVNIQTNPWFFSPDGLAQQDHNPGGRQRLLDNAAFFHALQNKFYSKFVKAIRDAGYAGPLCGSPWQAPAMVPHYYNLLSDYQVGWIDRHNYAGGGHLGYSMLSQPGSGELSAGLQQVIDRPFGISEWIHEYPCMYTAETPAAFAVYGMGLQGWGASYEFQSHATINGFAPLACAPGFAGEWEVDVPTQIGQYPTLARMILRGDVKTGDIISTRRVSLQNLQDGKFGFSDKVEQSGDVKSFSGACPPAAMAAGRCVVEFVDKSADSTFPDMGKYEQRKVITSNTGQLAWDYSDKGFFTVNTEGTKGVVGFAGGKEFSLGNVKIAMQTPYASLFITATDKQATLANGKTALISAVARNCNSGFQYLVFDKRLLDNGKAPILLEPVKANITFASRKIAAVNILDHDGNRTDKTVAFKDGSFAINGATDKALYYEVVFE